MVLRVHVYYSSCLNISPFHSRHSHIRHIFSAEPIYWQAIRFIRCLGSFICLSWRAQTILFDAFHGDENIEMIERNFRLISGKKMLFVSKE